MTHTDNAKTYCLVVSCPDTVGIVAAVSKFVAENNGSFIESNHYTDIEGEWFYFRNVINAPSLSISLQEFRQKFAAIAEKFDMQWNIRANNEKQKVVLFASHASHCLADLLHRWHSSELSCDIPCVISNHENLRSMVDWHGIPFHYIPVTKENKPEAFKQMNEVVQRYNADAIVLARYMQIIPPEICKDYAGRLINIHHSFLPSFIGANPYQKAYERGVKLIGATSHYVTKDLDEGPIIEQDVIRVSHNCSKDDLVRMGKDVESAVLAKALRYHLDDRVLVRGNKCVVFK